MTTVVPDDLAARPPGPGLAAALAAVELDAVPNDRMLSVLGAQYRQLCHEQARMAAVLAELGRCAGYPEPGQVDRLDVPERYASEESRAALRWTRRAAEWEHALADTVVHVMPELHAAWLAGLVDRPRVMVFDRYLLGCTAEQIGAICRVAVPRAPKPTTGQLAVLLRRMVLAVDPAAAERWYRKGVRERNVTAVMDPDGTVTLSGHGLPADDAEAACVRVQDLAAAAKRAGHPGLIGQIRCDLFLGLLDGRFHGMDTAQVIATLIAQYRPDGPGSASDSETGAGGEGGGPRPAATAPHADHARTGDTPAGEPAADSTSIDSRATGSTRTGGTSPGSAATGTGSGGAEPSGVGPDPVAAGGLRPTPGAAGPSGAVVGIEVRVALPTLLGHDDHPGELPGLGLLPAPETRARVALQGRAQWRFAVTDHTGRLLSEGVTRRRPTTVGGHPVRRDGPPGGIVELHIPDTLLHELASCGAGEWAAVIADIAAQHAARDTHLADLDARPDARFPGAALRRHTEIRDRTCVFPGCRHRAHTNDIDHTHDKAHGGPTVAANTAPACDHDHDVKHRGGWRLSQPEPGVFVWRSPLGGEYRTRGEFLLPELPDPIPVDLGWHVDHPTRSIEGPILQPYGPPERSRPPPPPRRELPDEPPF